jgi:hypothetical protein
LADATNLYLSGTIASLLLWVQQNTVALYFHTDAGINSMAGFRLTWTAYYPEPNGAKCLSALGFGASAVKNCGSDQSGTAGGIIQSPQYPSDYANNLLCIWNIRAPAGSVITLNVTAFNIEQDRDFFYALRPQDCSTSLIGRPRLTGLLSPQFFAIPQSSASIFFRSDATNGKSGFSLAWNAVASNCTGYVKANILNTSQVRT